MLDEEDKIPFTEHLEELRSRLIVCFVAVGIGFVAAYGFKEHIFEILTAPLIEVLGESGSTMVFTGLAEAFFTYLKVALLTGLMLASPVIIYEFWMFVSPGLYKHERRLLIPIVLLSTIFFVGGALFCYFLVFPYCFQFFLGFANENIKALPSMKEYLALSAKLLLAFGLVFELPLVITFMAKLGLVTVPFLRKNRKYAVLIFFAGAAMITPPDVVTQIMMAIPLMALYELSIFGAMVFGKKPPEASPAADASEASEG
jgi:sec-independent protein translocase protein TatC